MRSKTHFGCKFYFVFFSGYIYIDEDVILSAVSNIYFCAKYESKTFSLLINWRKSIIIVQITMHLSFISVIQKGKHHLITLFLTLLDSTSIYVKTDFGHLINKKFPEFCHLLPNVSNVQVSIIFWIIQSLSCNNVKQTQSQATNYRDRLHFYNTWHRMNHKSIFFFSYFDEPLVNVYLYISFKSQEPSAVYVCTEITDNNAVLSSSPVKSKCIR